MTAPDDRADRTGRTDQTDPARHADLPPSPSSPGIQAQPATDAAALPVRFETIEAPGGRCVGVATLARPRQLNALDLEMCRLLLDRLHEWASDESVACVMLEGEGERGFCAGGDVAAVVRQVRALWQAGPDLEPLPGRHGPAGGLVRTSALHLRSGGRLADGPRARPLGAADA